MTSKIVVLSTCASQEDAERIGSGLVEKRLAACVSIVPGVTSIYRWQGAIERAAEWLLLIKTRAELFEEVSAELKRLHTYEVPEIVSLDVTEGSPAYLAWIDTETEQGPGDGQQ
jgi:periplasmic divalent cation tolerance protein